MEDRWGSWFGRVGVAGLCLVAGVMGYNRLSERQGMPLRNTFSKLEQILAQPDEVREQEQVQVPVYEPVQKQEVKEEIVKPQEKIIYKTTDFSTDSDEVLLARMLYGEARNCSDEEMIDVAYTAINRANDGKRWNGETLREAVLKPWQYSCFNRNDPNLPKLKDPQKYDSTSWERCLDIARGVLSREYEGKNEGATHYFAKGTRTPNWVGSMTDISESVEYKHDFYREK